MMSIYSRTLLWIAVAAIVSFLFAGCITSENVDQNDTQPSGDDSISEQAPGSPVAQNDDYDNAAKPETDFGLIDPIQNVLDQVNSDQEKGKNNSMLDNNSMLNNSVLNNAMLDWSSFDASAKSGATGYGMGSIGSAGSAGMGGFGAGGGGGAIHRVSGGYPLSLGSRRSSSYEFNENEFSTFQPNRFNNVINTPFSTFGADVDTASYSILRYYINNHKEIPRNQLLRSEELINYFTYNYPNPKDGQPLAMTTELVQTPWNEDTQLLLIGVQTPKLKTIPPSNIVYLVDVSGSMFSDEKLPLLKDSIIASLDSFTEKDRISIVTYASDNRLLLSGANPVRDKKQIIEAVEQLDAGGFTVGERGLQMAYEEAAKHFIKGGNNRIILGTDGDLNVGISSANGLKAFVEDKRKNGVFLSVLGFGWGNLKDNRLEALADNGNGSYHYIDSIEEAKRVLVEDRESTLYTVAKDVKFQVDFNPAKVKGYRLIGYETRKLNTEDFKDDTKDGGEIGANQQVTVLYEIVPAGSSVEVAQTDSAYQKTEVIPSDDLATLAVRYKKPDEDVSQEIKIPISSKVRSKMSENIQFAAAVAEVGMLLNDSEFSGTATYESAIKLLKPLRSVQFDSYRAEFLDIVKKLNKIEMKHQNRPAIMGAPEVSGPLNERMASKFIMSHIQNINTCHTNILRYSPKAQGKMRISWTISSDGYPQNISIVDSNYPIEDVKECIINEIQTWVFPALPEGETAKIELPLNFNSSTKDDDE